MKFEHPGCESCPFFMRFKREQQLQSELEATAASLEAELAVGGLRGMRDYLLGRRKFGSRADAHRQLARVHVDIELSKIRLESDLHDQYSPYRCPGPVLPEAAPATDTPLSEPAHCAITGEAL